MKLVPMSVRQGVAVLTMVAALAGCGGAAPTAIIVFVSPTPAEPTPTPMATVTTPPTATPATTPSPSVSPSPSPTIASAACTGWAANQAFFVNAASKLHFDVYCAVLPSSWWLDSASYIETVGGYLEVHYKNAGGAELAIREHRWCPPEKMCIAPGATIGPASFGGLAGTLYLNGTTYTLQVGTSANPAYLMYGHGMTQGQFVAWAAAMLRVPKP